MINVNFLVCFHLKYKINYLCFVIENMIQLYNKDDSNDMSKD